MAKKDIKIDNSTIKLNNPTAIVPTTIFQDLSKSIKVSYQQYLKDLENDQKLRLIDTFLAFLVCVGILQFCFCLVGGSFPFNAFLGGFIATIGQFVLTVALRLQSMKENITLFKGILPERAFGDYIFASLILHFVILHFIN